MALKWADWLHSLCCLGVPNASQWGKKSPKAHEWADWLHTPYHLGFPKRSQLFGAGDKTSNGPQQSRLAT